MNGWLPSLSGQGEASAVALLALGVLWAGRHRLSPPVRSLVALAALARLAMPPWVRAPWPEPVAALPALGAARHGLDAWMSGTPGRVLATMAAAGTLVALARLAWQQRLISRELERSRGAPAGLGVRLERLAFDAGVAAPELRVSDDGAGPFAAGLRRPVIVLPAAANTLGPAALDAVLAHELAHHVRRDLAWRLAGHVLASLVWFNPLAHVLLRALVASREDGADDWAVRVSDATPDGYADALIGTARLAGLPPPAGVAAAHPLGRRLRRLLDNGANRAERPGRLALAVLLAAVAVALPGAAAPPRLGDAVQDDVRRIVVVRTAGEPIVHVRRRAIRR